MNNFEFTLNTEFLSGFHIK